jgi:hypothetical protein
MFQILHRTSRPSTATLVALSVFFANLHFYLPVFVFYLQQRGLNLAEVNLLQMTALVTQFLAEVPTGLFGDRFGRKVSVALGLVLMGISEASMLFARELWHFIALQAVLGVSFAFISGSQQALVVDSVPVDAPDRETQIKRGLGKLSAARYIGNVASFVLADAFFPDTQLARFVIPIMLTAGVLWLAAFTVVWMRERRAVHASTQRPSSLTLLRSCVQLLRHNPAYRRIVALSILADPLGFYWIALYQPLLARADVPVAWFGPALAAGALLAAWVSTHAEAIERRLSPRYGLLLLTVLPGLLYVVMGFAQSAASALILFIAQHGTMIAAQPLIATYTNQHIAPGFRATALSLQSLLLTLYLSAIGLPIGLLAEWSLPALFVVMGSTIMLNAMLLRVDEQS